MKAVLIENRSSDSTHNFFKPQKHFSPETNLRINYSETPCKISCHRIRIEVMCFYHITHPWLNMDKFTITINDEIKFKLFQDRKKEMIPRKLNTTLSNLFIKTKLRKVKYWVWQCFRSGWNDPKALRSKLEWFKVSLLKFSPSLRIFFSSTSSCRILFNRFFSHSFWKNKRAKNGVFELICRTLRVPSKLVKRFYITQRINNSDILIQFPSNGEVLKIIK